jgi:ABC-type antimicrobial peptide transport system permease subunit
MGAILLSVFGALALLLSAVGIYGVMTHGVARRAREIGVRVALGAGRGAVVRLVVRQAMRVAGAGLVIGAVAAAAAGQVLRSQLLGVSGRDPVTFCGGRRPAGGRRAGGGLAARAARGAGGSPRGVALRVTSARREASGRRAPSCRRPWPGRDR